MGYQAFRTLFNKHLLRNQRHSDLNWSFFRRWGQSWGGPAGALKARPPVNSAPQTAAFKLHPFHGYPVIHVGSPQRFSSNTNYCFSRANLQLNPSALLESYVLLPLKNRWTQNLVSDLHRFVVELRLSTGLMLLTCQEEHEIRWIGWR